MSREEFVEYKCDICGKVVKYAISKKDRPFKQIEMPSKNYDCEGRNYSKGTTKVDVCENCYFNYWDYVQSRYEVVDCYGVKVKIKGVAENE